MQNKTAQNDFQDLFVSEKIYNLVSDLEHSASNYGWRWDRMTRADQIALASLIKSLRRLLSLLHRVHESYISQTLEAEKEIRKET